MKKILSRIIGHLMYLANGENARELWYPVKQKLCERYGLADGTDIQYIDGKKCHACAGTGIYQGYHYQTGWYKEYCYKCYSGWYRRPRVVMLHRSRVGNHVFHRPGVSTEISTAFSETEIPKGNTIHGYIHHNRRKYGWLAFPLLLLLFDFENYKKWLKGLGQHWYTGWYKPKGWLYTGMHFIRHGRNAYPLRKLRERWQKPHPVTFDPEDLPF